MAEPKKCNWRLERLKQLEAELKDVNKFIPDRSNYLNQSNYLYDLQGAKVIRIRTLAQFLDAANFPSSKNPYGTPDSEAELPQEIYFINRKTFENRNIVQFELTSALDLQSVRAPKRQVTKKDFPAVGSFINA